MQLVLWLYLAGWVGHMLWFSYEIVVNGDMADERKEYGTTLVLIMMFLVAGFWPFTWSLAGVEKLRWG